MKHPCAGLLQNPKTAGFNTGSLQNRVIKIWTPSFHGDSYIGIKFLWSFYVVLKDSSGAGCWNVSSFERVSDSSYWSISELRTKWQWLELRYWIHCLPSARIKSAVKYFQGTLGNEMLHLSTRRPVFTSVGYIFLPPADSSVHINRALSI
jgi:hypothetical protein